MANVLIAYATKEGQTEKIAQRIARTLASEGYACELFDTDHPTAPQKLGRFQAVIVGAPIHIGSYPRSIVAFAREHKTFLEHVPSAFFSVGLGVASHTSDGRLETRRIVERFVERSGWRPKRVELFAGALLYSKYNFLTRYIMRQITKKEGGDTDTSRDYEYTDWSAVDRFALEVVREAAPETKPVGEGARKSSLQGEMT